MEPGWSNGTICREDTAGWVISGPVQTPGRAGKGKLVCRARVSEAEDDTNHQLRMFWDVDTFGVRVDKTPIYSHNEQRAIKIMKVIVPADGVGLRISIAMETESTTIAKQLHHGRETSRVWGASSRKDPNLAQGYGRTIGAYVEKGFARKLRNMERAESTEEWLLPHHPVLSPHKPLPRVVFDSAALHDGVCLNNCLEAGPSLAGVSTPFKHVGLDYAGPFQVRIKRNRVEKRYICLFTCLHMRTAVHLEVVHSLKADPLRRF